MQMDFYQLGGTPPEQVIASIAEKILAQDGRLLVVASDEGALARLDRQLWDQGAASFLPHWHRGRHGRCAATDTPFDEPDAPNLARNLLIADGEWRDAASLMIAASICSTASLWRARGWRGSCSPAGKGSSGAIGRKRAASGVNKS
jgi:hypothetical protein